MLVSATEKTAVKQFLNFISTKNPEDFNSKNFGLWEFSEFVQFLSIDHSETTVYITSTTIRRFCRKLTELNIKFKSSPINWPCPRKPDIDHFDPLSKEQYKKLCLFIDNEIESIRNRLKLIEKAKTNDSKLDNSGLTFGRGKKPFFTYQEKLTDVLSAVLSYFPDFPIDCSKRDFLIGGKYGVNQRKVDYQDMDNEIKIIRKRFTVQKIKEAKRFILDYPDLMFQDLLNIIVPSPIECLVIRQAICLETGWSPDIVSRINPNDFIFQELDPNTDYVFIKSVKHKGTQRNNVYREAKSMLAPSHKYKPNSAYSLLNLWLKRTTALRQTKKYRSLVKDLGYEPLFICVNNLSSISQDGPLKVIHPDVKTKYNNTVTNKYYDENLGFRFDDRALRPTHFYYRGKDKNTPHALLVTLFGHSSSTVTEEFYENGSHFEQDRKDRLYEALNKIDDSLRDGSFAGELIPLREGKTIKDKIFTVFADQSNKNPIAVCSDPYRPNWPGQESRVEIGKKCNYFSKCLLCSRSRVFSDNLPFVVDRYLYLEKLKRELREDHFSVFIDEYSSSKNVVESWPYQDDVEEAKDRTFLEGFMLPPTIGDML